MNIQFEQSMEYRWENILEHHYVLWILITTGNDEEFSHDKFQLRCRLDDLLVGAPLYTVKKDGRILADAGRVDVFYQTPEVCLEIFFERKKMSIDAIWFSIISYESKVSKEHVKVVD